MRVGHAEQPSVTVSILTYNGEEYIRRILEMLRVQQYSGEREVLIIDSGSTDSTLDIVAEFPEVRLVRIPNDEFGHGKTRNLAASLATGEIVAYLTHDAVPAHEHWLSELVAPFGYSDSIVAVMGKQIPRSDCFPLLKYEIEGVFSGLGSDFGVSVFGLSEAQRSDAGLVAAKAFYSDVNSAARRSFLTEKIPYRDVRYAEDQLFGQDLLEAGYLKAYAPGATVEHSNDLTLDEYGPRMFDETVALREIGREVPALSSRQRVRLTLRGVIVDTFRIWRDSSFGRKRKVYWTFVNPRFHFRKWKFHNLGARFDLADKADLSPHSLEMRKKEPQATTRHSGSES